MLYSAVIVILIGCAVLLTVWANYLAHRRTKGYSILSTVKYGIAAVFGVSIFGMGFATLDFAINPTFPYSITGLGFFVLGTMMAFASFFAYRREAPGKNGHVPLGVRADYFLYGQFGVLVAFLGLLMFFFP